MKKKAIPIILFVIILTSIVIAQIEVGYDNPQRPKVNIAPPIGDINVTIIGGLDTNATTECNDGEYLDGSSACLNFNNTVFANVTAMGLGGLDDTNATTECNDGEYLDGAGFCINLNNTIFFNLTSQGILPDTNFSNCDDGEYGDGSNFCINLNDTIIDLNKITYYNSTTADLVEATESGGSLSDTFDYNGESYNLTETAGAPGLDVRFNFTEVDDFNKVIIRMRMDGSDHEVDIQLWDIVDNDWENYATVIEVEEYQVIELGVYDSSDHIDVGNSNNVTLRFYQSSPGNTNHEYFFDWIQLVNGPATYSTNEIDPLSYHKDKNINATDYNITADYFFGNGSQLTGIIIGDTDTNATTECADGEYLDGSSFCLNLNNSIFINLTSQGIKPDTNFSNCGDGEYGDGSNFCINLNDTIFQNVTEFAVSKNDSATLDNLKLTGNLNMSRNKIYTGYGDYITTVLSYIIFSANFNVTETVNAKDGVFQNNVTADMFCLNSTCGSYIYNNGSHSIWK